VLLQDYRKGDPGCPFEKKASGVRPVLQESDYEKTHLSHPYPMGWNPQDGMMLVKELHCSILVNIRKGDIGIVVIRFSGCYNERGNAPQSLSLLRFNNRLGGGQGEESSYKGESSCFLKSCSSQPIQK
jgi:hypothetical protein